MTILELKEKIESWPETTMPFCIEDVFSWRGVYAEPACAISTCADDLIAELQKKGGQDDNNHQ